MQIPEWWLVLSGLFFAFALLAAVFCLVLVVVLIGTIKRLSAQVSELADRVRGVGQRVEELVVISKGIAQRVGRNAGDASENINVITRSLAGRQQQLSTAGVLISLFMQGLRWWRARRS